MPQRRDLAAIAAYGVLWLTIDSVALNGALAWTIYLGLVPTTLGFLTWNFALGRTTAGRMASLTYSFPSSRRPGLGGARRVAAGGHAARRSAVPGRGRRRAPEP